MTRSAAAKRAFDLALSFAGLLLASPLLLAVAALVKFSDRGPVFYRQTRIGQFGRPFRIWKFRTMVVGADKLGPGVTRDRDPRITRIGRLLRKTKIDELPQLLNVLSGEMSFVGPRPEVPEYVAFYTPEQRRVLDLKPGITDLATLEFAREEELLAAASGSTEQYYLQVCMPEKIRLNLSYAERSSLFQDLLIIFRTLFFWSGSVPAPPAPASARLRNAEEPA